MKKIAFLLALALCSCNEKIVTVDFDITPTNVSLYDGNDGKLEVIVISGTPPYNYSDGDSINSTGIFTHLKAKTYTVKVVDSKQESAIKTITLTQPGMPVTSTVTATPVTTYGGSNGSITVTVTSGIPPYTYSNSISTNTTSANTFKFDGLHAGIYFIQVTSSNGGQPSLNSIEVTQPAQLIFNCTFNIPSHYGFADGKITANITSGNFPFIYKIGSNVNTSNEFTGLITGTYTITVTDNSGQTVSHDVTLSQPGKNLVYSSANPPDNLSSYLNTFKNNNRFSISFWYNTTGDLNRDNPLRIQACLFSVEGNSARITCPWPISGDHCIAIDLTKSNIQVRRFDINGLADIVSYNSTTIWQGLHHVVITYDGAYEALYVDNVFYGKQQSVYGINSNVITLKDEYPGYTPWPYAGTITEFYLYDEALTAADVTKLYNRLNL